MHFINLKSNKICKLIHDESVEISALMFDGQWMIFWSFYVKFDWQEHVIYLWKDTSEELHFSLVQLLHGKVEKLYSKFKKSQPEGKRKEMTFKGLNRVSFQQLYERFIL